MTDPLGDGSPSGDRWTVSQGRAVPPPFVWEPMTAEQNTRFLAKRRSRSIALGLLLGALALLFFGITIVRMFK